MNLKKFKPVDFGETTSEIKDFVHISIRWSKPISWSDINNPQHIESRTNDRLIYAIINKHGNRVDGPVIQYIGITEDGVGRFKSHDYEDKMPIGSYTYISFGELTSPHKKKLANLGRDALEEIEHILIWLLWDNNDLYNGSKIFTLPGWGKNGTEAYHIKNKGYRFESRMPKQIIYPWMIVK